MRKYLAALLPASAIFLLSASAHAELSNRDARVIVGHYHLNVTSVEEHKRFWVDTLGGRPVELGSPAVEVIEFPDVYLFLHEQPPTGPTRGTSFDHIGFAVPDVPEVAARVVANGYERTVGREPGPGETPSPPTSGDYGRFSYQLRQAVVLVDLDHHMSSEATAHTIQPL